MAFPFWTIQLLGMISKTRKWPQKMAGPFFEDAQKVTHCESRTTSQNVSCCCSWPWRIPGSAWSKLIKSGRPGPKKSMESWSHKYWRCPSDGHSISEGFKHRIRLHDLVLPGIGGIHGKVDAKKHVFRQQRMGCTVFLPMQWSKQPRAKTLSNPSSNPVKPKLWAIYGFISLWGNGCFVKLGLARTPLLTTQERNRKNIDVVIEDTHVVRRNGWLSVWSVLLKSPIGWNQNVEYLLQRT